MRTYTAHELEASDKLQTSGQARWYNQKSYNPDADQEKLSLH